MKASACGAAVRKRRRGALVPKRALNPTCAASHIVHLAVRDNRLKLPMIWGRLPVALKRHTNEYLLRGCMNGVFHNTPSWSQHNTPGPAYHYVPALWTPPLLHSSSSFTSTVSTRAAWARGNAPTVRYRTMEHPPPSETY